MVVVVAYVSAFYFLSLALRSVPVAVAYAVWSGAGIALIAAIGWLLLDQRLNTASLIGISMIVGGVAVLNLFSSSN